MFKNIDGSVKIVILLLTLAFVNEVGTDAINAARAIRIKVAQAYDHQRRKAKARHKRDKAVRKRLEKAKKKTLT